MVTRSITHRPPSRRIAPPLVAALITLALGIAAPRGHAGDHGAESASAGEAEIAAAAAAKHEVAQKHKRFSVQRLKVKVGDTVHFPNEDPFFHNIFSLSDAATFDLGSYPKGESRSVTLDEPGMVEVECAIHPTMQMTIEVEE